MTTPTSNPCLFCAEPAQRRLVHPGNDLDGRPCILPICDECSPKAAGVGLPIFIQEQQA